MHACQGLMGLIFGHKFQPRYSETKGQFSGKISRAPWSGDSADEIGRLAESMCERQQTYIHDVCRRCGTVIAKPPAQEPVNNA